jgi:hypothetical protein
VVGGTAVQAVQVGIVALASILRHRTAGMEPAPRGKVHGIRGLALQDLALAALPGIPLRDHGQEGLRVWVQWMSNDVPGRPSSTIRPRYMTAMRSAKGAAVGRSWVIIRIPMPLCRQRPSSSDRTPRSHRDVQHGHGLVRYQQVGLQDQAGGDGDPLPLPAGELVRVPVRVELRRRQLGSGQRLRDPSPALGAGLSDAVDEHALLHGLSDPDPRIQGFVGSW